MNGVQKRDVGCACLCARRCDACAVQSELLPLLAARSQDALGLFVAAVQRVIWGVAFSGLAVELSPIALEFVTALPRVELVQEDELVHAWATDQVGAPWHLDRVDERTPFSGAGVYTFSLTGVGIDMYVMDSGINTAHTEFTGRIEDGANFASDATGIEDCAGHGTHVAGLAAGTTYGVAKEAVIVPVRVYGCDNSGPVSEVVLGINYVIETMARRRRPAVINMSFGTSSVNSILNTAVNNLIAAGGIVVVAAGTLHRALHHCKRAHYACGARAHRRTLLLLPPAATC